MSENPKGMREVARQVVTEMLSDPLTLPAEFRGFIPRWVEARGIQVPRSDVIGAYTTGADVNGLGAPTHGRPCMVRAGATPYEFLQMTYDDVYGHWVASQIAASYQVGAFSVTENNWTDVPYTAFPGFYIPNFKALYDADLRPQVFLSMQVGTGSSGTTKYLRAGVYEVANNDTNVNQIGYGGEISDNSGFQMGGWSDITFSSAPTDAHAYIRPQAKVTTGSESLSNMALCLRWRSL